MCHLWTNPLSLHKVVKIGPTVTDCCFDPIGNNTFLSSFLSMRIGQANLD